MDALHKWPRYAGIYFTGKGVVFLGLAAAGATALPPTILAGLSVTWFVFGMMLLSAARRLRLSQAPAEAAAPQTRVEAVPVRTELRDAA